MTDAERILDLERRLANQKASLVELNEIIDIQRGIMEAQQRRLCAAGAVLDRLKERHARAADSPSEKSSG